MRNRLIKGEEQSVSNNWPYWFRNMHPRKNVSCTLILPGTIFRRSTDPALLFGLPLEEHKIPSGRVNTYDVVQ